MTKNVQETPISPSHSHSHTQINIHKEKLARKREMSYETDQHFTFLKLDDNVKEQHCL